MTRSRHGLIGRLFTAGVAAAAILAGGFAHAATELTVWHAYRGDEKAAFEKVVAMYNAKQKERRRQDAGGAVRRVCGQDLRVGAARQGPGRLHLRAGPSRRLGRGRPDHRADRLLRGRQGHVAAGPRHDEGDDLSRHGLRTAAQLQEHRDDLQHGAGEDAAEDHRRTDQAREGHDGREGRPLRARLRILEFLLPRGADERVRRPGVRTGRACPRSTRRRTSPR